jgi:hypothetical protein
MESQPTEFVVVKVAVLFGLVYVLPSIQVYDVLQVETISVAKLEVVKVRSSVIVESQPTEFIVVKVAVLLGEV